MTEQTSARALARRDESEMSLLELGAVLLRRRRLIIAVGILGGIAGVALALMNPRTYTSSTTFIPQGSDAGPSGLAAAATQLGIKVPTTASVWGPPIYVELLRSRALLEPLVRDTLTLPEEGGRRAALTDLLQVSAATPALRTERAVRALGRIITVSENQDLGAVTLSVTTRWPSVSQELAKQLVSGVNQFNLQTRKSQAAAERQFVEGQAADAERALRQAEDALQSFLQRNRTWNAPELNLEHDRLARDVNLRQQVYTTLVQNREDARIREVRDIPVITLLEEPGLPVLPQPRKLIQKAVLGGLAGMILASLLTLLAETLARARRTPREDARHFFELVDEATPRFLRRAK